MPRKSTKQIVEEVIQEEQITEEVEEEVEIVKPKRVLSEAQLANLQRAREAAAIKKKALKETKDKANNKDKLELEIKAMEYDQLLKKRQEFVEGSQAETPVMKPTKAKKLVKKIYEEESDDEEVEEVIVKKVKPKKVETQQKQNYNQMLYQSTNHSIQEKLLDERAKSLMQKLMPSY